MIDLYKTKIKSFGLKADTTVEVIEPKGIYFTLEELQEYVGGYIEIIKLPNNFIMVLDEEGLLKKKKVNKQATHIAGSVIVGDVIVCKSKMVR